MTKKVEKTILMKKSHFNKWYKSLISGKYKQGRDVLYNKQENSYCCLGVMQKCSNSDVEVYKALPSLKWLKANNVKFLDIFGEESDDPYLGGDNDSAASLNDNGYTFKQNDSAASLNDNGYTFKQIAQRLKNRVKFIK